MNTVFQSFISILTQKSSWYIMKAVLYDIFIKKFELLVPNLVGFDVLHTYV